MLVPNAAALMCDFLSIAPYLKQQFSTCYCAFSAPIRIGPL
jgi:hypothetical protein